MCKIPKHFCRNPKPILPNPKYVCQTPTSILPKPNNHVSNWHLEATLPNTIQPTLFVCMYSRLRSLTATSWIQHVTNQCNISGNNSNAQPLYFAYMHINLRNICIVMQRVTKVVRIFLKLVSLSSLSLALALYLYHLCIIAIIVFTIIININIVIITNIIITYYYIQGLSAAES